MRKKVLTLIMALAMLLSLVPTVLAADFKDQADVDEWAEEAVDRWHEEEVLNGGANGNFDPKGELTRAQAAQTIVNLMNLEGSGKTADLSKFADYDTAVKGQWSEDALEIAVAAGIIKGVGRGDENLLDPNGTVSREMMFVMIARALGIPEADEADKDIPDIENASDWAVGSINALVNIGAIHGVDPAGTVDPASDINRQTTAVLFDQLIGGYANKDGETATIVEGRITLVVADNVKVEGTADPDMPIIVAGVAANVDMEKVEGEAKVQVNVSDVKIENAPVGTEIKAADDVENVMVGDVDVTEEANNDYTVPAEEQQPSTGGSTGGGTTTTTYTVTLTTPAEMDGTLTSASTLTGLSSGAKVTVVATPAAGKDLTKLEVGTTDVTSSAVKDDEGKYTYELTVTGNVTVTATFGAVKSVDVYFYAVNGKFPTNACYGGTNGDTGTPGNTTNPGTCDSGFNSAVGEGADTQTPSDPFNVYKITVTPDVMIDFTKLTTPTYGGNTLLGWTKTKGSSTVDVKANGSATIDNSKNVVKFYAVWAEQGAKYVINFDANGGTISEQTCFSGNNVNVGADSSTQNPGTCNGGYNDATGSSGATQAPYTGFYVTLDAGFEFRVEYLTPDPTREGYVFDGWYDAEEGGNKVATFVVSADVHIYAHWRDAQHTVTFYANGGSFPKNACYAGDNAQTGSSDITQDPGSCFGGFNDKTGSGTTTENPAYEGYKIGVKDGTTIDLSKMQGAVNGDKELKGWATTADGTALTQTTVKVESDLVYYAVWGEATKA